MFKLIKFYIHLFLFLPTSNFILFFYYIIINTNNTNNLCLNSIKIYYILVYKIK